MTTGCLRIKHDFGDGGTAQVNLSRSIGHYDSQLFCTCSLPDPLTGIGVQPGAAMTPASACGQPLRMAWHQAFAAGLPPVGSIFDWDGPALASARQSGSSPRVRGTGAQRGLQCNRPRFIPARAGNRVG